MGWKDRYGNRGGSGGGLFVKLANGESVDFVVYEDPEPHESITKWNGEKSEKCGRNDAEAQIKILVAAYVVSKRAKGAKAGEPVNGSKILKLSPKVFDQLCEAIDDDTVGGHEQVYRMKRNGEGLQTTYTITRLDKVSPEILRAVRGEDPPDLGRYGDPMEAPAEEETPAKGKATAAVDADDEIDPSIPF